MAEYKRSDVKIHERISPSRHSKQATTDSDMFTRKKLNEFFAAWLFHYRDSKREWHKLVRTKAVLGMRFRRRCFFAWVAHVKRMKHLRYLIYK